MNKKKSKWLSAFIMIGLAILGSIILWFAQNFLLKKSEEKSSRQGQPETPQLSIENKALKLTDLELTALAQGNIMAYSAYKDADTPRLVIISSDDKGRYIYYYKKNENSYQKLFHKADLTSGIAGFYKNSIWTSDIDNDGMSEFMCATFSENTKQASVKNIIVFLFTKDCVYTIEGTTSYNPVNGMSQKALVIKDIDATQEHLKQAARKLFYEAQFDLAEPKPFSAFFEYRHLDGAVVSGDKPHWSVNLLPSHARLYLGDKDEATILSYTSIVKDDANIIIECYSTNDAWKHSFRLTLCSPPKGELPPTDGIHQYAILEGSDGLRLTGWVRLAD